MVYSSNLHTTLQLWSGLLFRNYYKTKSFLYVWWFDLLSIRHTKAVVSNWSSKGPCDCRFSFQLSKNTPDPNKVCSCLVGWLVGWSKSGVFLLDWNENLQPHGPLLDQFDTCAIKCSDIKGALCSFEEDIFNQKRKIFIGCRTNWH